MTPQPTIKYHLDVLHPETFQPMSHVNETFRDWSAVEQQLLSDKTRFFDRSNLPIKYTAYDGTVELAGSWGVA